MLALPKRTVVDDTGVLLSLLHVVAADLGELGEEEEDGDGSSEAGDGEVDVPVESKCQQPFFKRGAEEMNTLDGGELNRVRVLEEGVGGNGGTDEGGETVERLGKVEAESGALRGTEDGDVGAVGSEESSAAARRLRRRRRRSGRKRGKRKKDVLGVDLEGCETATDDKGAAREGPEDGVLGGRPEEEGAGNVETKTDEDGGAVRETGGKVRRGDGKDKVGAKVGNLDGGGLKLGDVERVLDLLVENVDEGVRETPEEEEGGDLGVRGRSATVDGDVRTRGDVRERRQSIPDAC